MIIAHTSPDGQKQSLLDHLLTVGEECFHQGKKINMPYTALLLGLIHDLGKADRNFQSYILGDEKSKVNHSSAGGKYIDYIKNNEKLTALYSQLLEYVIFAHHGLFDVLDSENEINRMIKRKEYDKDNKYNFNEDVLNFAKELENAVIDKYNYSMTELFSLAYEEFTIINKKIQLLIEDTHSDHLITLNHYHFYLSLLIRLLLSILKENDIYDSTNWVLNESEAQKRLNRIERKRIFELATNELEIKASKYRNNSGDLNDINYWRTFFSDQLVTQVKMAENGVFTLSLPTGSGKTQSVLRFATQVAKNFDKDHVYYITAFLSVLEQNATDIKNTLLTISDSILEHHSNVIQEKDLENSDEENYQFFQEQFLIDSWNSPYILTTMVQFFNTLFKGRSSQIRRFSQLANSVLIIDEVQSIPLKVIYPFNLALNFLSQIMNTTIILCTATQPLLEYSQLDYPLKQFSHDNNLIVVPEEAKSVFERVQAINYLKFNPRQKLTTNEIIDNVLVDLREEKNVLVILNTKKAVSKLHEQIMPIIDNKVYYLTTNMCAKHRLDRIKEIRAHLTGEEPDPIVVISTQLIEAGVDLDFDTVYRSLTGVDAFVQAAGRCNRNGKRPKGYLKIFEYVEENTDYIQEIQQAKNAAFKSFYENGVYNYGAVFNLEGMKDNYYQNLYTENKEQMNYLIESNEKTLIDLLGYNIDTRFKGMKNNLFQLAQSFNTVARNFNLIETETQTVIVHYHNEELIEQLRRAIDSYDFVGLKKILNKLQPYTIQVYNIREMSNYVETYLEGRIIILQSGYYSSENPDIGLKLDELETMIL